MQAGSIASLGLGLPARLLQAESAASVLKKPISDDGHRATIRSCILIYFYGGPSHIDTWDMKPTAPREVRGEFAPISTTVPGMQVCEHLPRMARMAHKWSVVRSMHHPMTNHNAAAVEAMCGRTPLRGDLELLDDDALSFPAYGAVLSYLMPDSAIGLPHVALPHTMINVVQLPGQTAGFLGAAYERFQITSDPNAPQFDVSSLKLPSDVSANRMKTRNQLLSVIDRQPESPPRTPQRRSIEEHYGKAFALLRSEAVRHSLDIAKEPAALRDRYGRNTLGQSMLLARRLVESGVRFVNVNDRIYNGQDANWDSHQSVFPRHRDHLLPPADQGFSALIEDLDSRGLLDTTLVIGMGEFGRSPQDQFERGPRPLAALLFGRSRRRRNQRGPSARFQRQNRRLSGHRSGVTGRPGSDDLFVVRPRSDARNSRHHRPPLATRRGPVADRPALAAVQTIAPKRCPIDPGLRPSSGRASKAGSSRV